MSVYNTYTAMMWFELATSLPLYRAAFCFGPARFSQLKSGGAVVAEALLDKGLRILTEQTRNGKRFIPAYELILKSHKLGDSLDHLSE
jgi:hypothetical protein